MDRQDIKLILRCPYKDIIEYLLNAVNLTDKEIKLLKEVDIKGNTEERTAEHFDVSTRHVQSQRQKAYQKITKVWSKNHLAEVILKELKEN